MMFRRLSSPIGRILCYPQYDPCVDVSMCSLLNRCLLSRSLASSCSSVRLSSHVTVLKSRMMGDFFAPQSSIFVSDAWNDGTSTFLSHLKEAIEKHTLLNVRVYGLGINQVMSAVCCVDQQCVSCDTRDLLARAAAAAAASRPVPEDDAAALLAQSQARVLIIVKPVSRAKPVISEKTPFM